MFPRHENWSEDWDDPLFAMNGELRTDVVHLSAMTALLQAQAWAADTGWESLRTPHLFMGILSMPDYQIREWGRRIATNLDHLANQFAMLFHQSSLTPHKPKLHREFLSNNAIAVLRLAIERAKTHGRQEIRQLDVVISLFENPDGIIGECFAEVGTSVEELTAMALEVELSGSHDELEI